MSFWHSACSTSSPDARTARKEESEEPDISSLLRMLGSVSDPRGRRGRQYPLDYVLAVCVVAMLAGARSYAEIARHAADMPQPLLKKLGARWDWFKLRYAWPGMSVIWNVLTRVDAAELDRITGTWIAARARKDRKGEWILALDGKVMRGAWTSGNDKVTMFSALLHDEAVTIAQVRVPDTTNEITQVEELPDAADIPEDASVLVTADAAHAQNATAEIIAGKEGRDYLVTVKKNQPSLCKAAAAKIIALLPGAPHDVVEERSRGRIKKWSCWRTGADGIDFPHMAVMVLDVHKILRIVRADLDIASIQAWIVNLSQEIPTTTPDELARAVSGAFPHYALQMNVEPKILLKNMEKRHADTAN